MGFEFYSGVNKEKFWLHLLSATLIVINQSSDLSLTVHLYMHALKSLHEEVMFW